MQVIDQDDPIPPVECPYKMGDLLRVTKDLVIRKDGFTFGEADCDEEGKIPKDWMIGSDSLPEGTLCSFVQQGVEDPEYAIVQRDLIGRVMAIRLAMLELVSSIDDAIGDGDG